jgi:SAM-dependent methyltransferase
VKRRAAKIPLMGPGADVLEELMAFSVPALRAAAENRGLTIRRRATRAELANRLFREAVRRRAESLYAEQDESFLSVTSSYEPLLRLVKRLGRERMVEVGCGTGLMVTRLEKILPPHGWYFGFDHAATAVAKARERVEGDARFRFAVGDAEDMALPRDADCVMLSWMINWLDTHTVDRMMRRLARACPDATMVCAVAFLACVERRAGVPDRKSRDLGVAGRYLAGGDRKEAARIWDLSRFECYRRSLTANFHVTATHVQPNARIVWVARPRQLQQPRAVPSRQAQNIAQSRVPKNWASGR